MDDLKKKVFVAGLDGVPETLITSLISAGELPNFKRILGSGFKLLQMDASIPEVSSTSWTSFYTGVNPGEHGIYGFMELKPGTYSLKFPNSGDVAAPSLWEIVGKNVEKTSTLSERFSGRFARPLRSIVLNIPQTYPARPMNGLLTAGFVCPDLKKGTYPPEFYDYLTGVGYMQDVDSTLAVKDPDVFFNEIMKSLEKRLDVYEHLMTEEAWDLCIGVVTETDRLHHFFFDAAYDRGHTRYRDFHRVYEAIDELVGRLYTRFMDLTDGKGLFLTMSDHGFTVIKKEVYLNRWLMYNDFLKVNEQRDFFEKIDEGSRAFVLDPSRIYVNIEGTYPRGFVRESDRAAVVKDLREALEGLVDDDGSPVIKAVYGAEELYSGPMADKAPDLVCLPHDGYDLKGSFRIKEVFGSTAFRGMHIRYDAHVILPADEVPDRRPHIEDLAAVILEGLAH